MNDDLLEHGEDCLVARQFSGLLRRSEVTDPNFDSVNCR